MATLSIALACSGDDDPERPDGSTAGASGGSTGDAASGGRSSGGSRASSGGGRGDASPGDASSDAATQPPCRGGGIPIPDEAHVAPDDVCVTAVATGQGKLRQIAFAAGGDLYGVRQDGIIRRYRDVDGDGMFAPGAPEQVDIATTGGNGNNAHIDDATGYLYAGSPEGVRRYSLEALNAAADAGAASDAGSAAGVPVVVGQPSSGRHPYHTVHLYGDWLYVHSGSADNVDTVDSPEYSTNRALIKRFPIASFDPAAPFQWEQGEVFALGVRNAVGFTQQPETGDIIAVVNGTDELRYNGEDIHQQNPGEEIRRLQAGGKYGFPYCFSALQVASPSGELFPPGTQLHTEVEGFVNPHDDAWCQANSLVPESLLDAHAAPLDIVFLGERTAALPERWVGGAFVTLHGSWNREPPTGEKVVWVPVGADGKFAMPAVDANGPKFEYEVVFGGERDGKPIDGAWGWSAGGTGEDLFRPVGVAVSPRDGALYVSSDNAPLTGTQTDSDVNGALYRISLR